MLFQVARQSYFDMNDILLGTSCHFLHCLIFKFVYPNTTTRDSVNFQTNSGSSFRSMPLARKFLLSDLLSNLLSLRSSGTSIKFSSMLNLSVLQALSPSFYYSLSSPPCPSSLPAYSSIPTVIVHQHLTLRQLSNFVFRL